MAKKEKADIKKPEVIKPQKSSSKRWMKLMLGIAVVFFTGAPGYLWMQNQRNPFLAFLTIAVLGTGIYLIYKQLRHQEPESVIVVQGEAVRKGPVNSLNIYAKRDKRTERIYHEKMVFEWVENPEGQPMQCLNNNKWYHIHIWDLSINRLVPFILPDGKYVDPSIMARYLELPAQKKYLRHRDSLLKYIAPGIMALMVGIGFLVIIILAG